MKYLINKTSMRNILFLLLWLILSNSLLAVTTDPTERLKAFKERMEATIRQNEKNDELGLSGANVYFIVDGQWIEEQGEVISGNLFKQVNDQLKAYNETSETKFYIGLRGTGAVPAVADEAFSESVSSSTTEYLRNGGAGMRERVIGRAIEHEKKFIGEILNKPHVNSGKEKVIFTFSKYYAELTDLTNGTSRKIFGFGAHYYTPGASIQGSILKNHYASNKDAYNFISNIENNLSGYTSAAFEILKSSPFDSDPQFTGPCNAEMQEALLASFAEHSWLQEGSPFKKMIEQNPCLLQGTHKIGEGLGYESEWMKEFNQVFGTASMAALAPAVIHIVGPAILRHYGAQKARDFAIGVAVDVGLQTAIGMVFENKSFEQALIDIDKFSALASGAESLTENVYVAAGVSCLYDGVIENGQIDKDFTVSKFSVECATGALSAVIANKILKGGGRLFRKLKGLAEANPLRFGSGLAAINIADKQKVRTICEYLGLDASTTDKILSACFVAGTPVLMADGSYKSIEQVVAGDLVMAFDEKTGKSVQGAVTQAYSRQSAKLIEIMTGAEGLLCTPEHPFYISGQWIEAKNLTSESKLQSETGDFVKITSVTPIDTVAQVYNFEVQEFSNYYVGKHNVLAHNLCIKLPDDLLAIFARLNTPLQEAIAKLGDKSEAFLKDLKDNPVLFDLFNNATNFEQLLESWKVLNRHSSIRKHVASLKKVSELLNDADFIEKLPNKRADFDAIIDAVKNPLDDGTASKLVKLSTHLDNIKQVVNKHSGADGFERLMVDLKNPSFAMQDGAVHMLNDVKNFPKGSVKKFDYEFDGDGVACTKCRFDVELTSGTPKLIEYKSWSLENIPNISSKQLTEYFRSATSIGDIKYVFNKLKTSSIGDVKSQFQLIIGNNAKVLFEANPDLFKTIKNSDGTPLIIQNWKQLEGFAKGNPNFYECSLFDFIVVK